MTIDTIEVIDDASTVSASHDSFIRGSMHHIEIARDFLEKHLPPSIIARIQFDTLTAKPDSFINDKHKISMSDILYSVNIDHSPSYIYVVVEHQSTPQRLMPYRMLKYVLEICDRHLRQQSDKHDNKKLPIILPLVFYNGKASPYPYSTDIYDCFADPELAKAFFCKPFRLIDVTTIPDEELATHQHAAAMELLAKHIHTRDRLKVIQLMVDTDFFVLLPDIGSGKYMEFLIKYILDQSDTGEKTQVLSLLTDPKVDKRGNIMTIAEALRQEGIQQGIEQGIQQGRKEGEHKNAEKVAKRLLAMGKLSFENIADVSGLSMDEIKALQAANN
ncbi:MAG: Rpn family recombination-promoting nuclease/putative transposase [Gammaproteobacteria bacterium]|nr:Rpn family recombination-promoting nuclease/putative transposase [Gammaproteobacteria bacterium]